MESQTASNAVGPSGLPKQDLPVPMILILVYVGYSILATAWSLGTPGFFIGPFSMGPLMGLAYKGGMIFVLTICLIGLWMRRAWGWKLSLGWFFFRIAFTLFTLVISLAFLDETIANVGKLVPESQSMDSEGLILLGLVGGSLFGLAIDGIICYYLLKKRDFFIADKQAMDGAREYPSAVVAYEAVLADKQAMDGAREYPSAVVAYEAVLARRCWAAILDYFLFGAIVLGYMILFGPSKDVDHRSDSESMILLRPGFLTLNGLWLVYFPVTESLLGYTLGKGAFGLKVVRERKKDFPFKAALKRHLLDPLEFFFVPFGIVAILMVKFTKDHKRLGDMWAHTRVVRED